ncbi:hypothetical protein Q8791_23040 [Nocardiopsis sp. CT-R113]|uniref:Uncharacterized protein n=1 Tax=Nocardiopsis codii TaxID=3065942 RepID=A0ABU7KD18_9ACTN|nr:hypothetical protein [Nocardiopsis sp. CT-R113]MEE2040097.1 hypothetical protein [Nocardiopsis sp. CT-R113]
MTPTATTLEREAFDRRRLVDEYRGHWVVDPATVDHTPTGRCPLCGAPQADRDVWAEHMAAHNGPALSWLARWQDTHADA